MSATPKPKISVPKDLAKLVERCTQLCREAEAAVSGIPEKRESFLADNLEDALDQLELILRVLDEEKSGKQRAEGGLLKRLSRLARRAHGDESAEEENDDFKLPDLSASQHHGLQGNSWTIPLPELIGFLAFGGKTGLLCVDSPKENFVLGLVDGNLMHATSDCTPEGLRLGEVLVGLGFLTRRQLERFLESNDVPAHLSGEALLKGGMISDEELRMALTHQVRQLFDRVVNTNRALFRFREGMKIQLTYQVDLNTTQLLLESATVQDELKKTPEQSWDAWNNDVLSEIQGLVMSSPHADKEAPSAPATSTEHAGETKFSIANEFEGESKPEHTSSFDAKSEGESDKSKDHEAKNDASDEHKS